MIPQSDSSKTTDQQSAVVPVMNQIMEFEFKRERLHVDSPQEAKTAWS